MFVATDDRLAHLMSILPQRSITLLEDIDAAFIKRCSLSLLFFFFYDSRSACDDDGVLGIDKNANVC